MRVEDSMNQFPVGMRVLAVDDDPACLKLLEALLRRCQYHVTITDRATMALKMLRDNKDVFDLVISDVHMPDMDGFKLLELVGLEMDLPVIMLSADGETKTVMKGITHGAVNYLLKPVRIEELRNIWQHAIRRRKCQKGCQKPGNVDSDDGHGHDATSNGKLCRKRKDRIEEDEDEDCCEEGMQESEDPSAQKRPRVVWSIELHREFVAAVNQLGLDKAVPKRILDLMKVEGLTRENVASHLQKYRLYLRRPSAVARQQARTVAALGGRGLPYLPMYSMDELGEQALSSYQPNGVIDLTTSEAGKLQEFAHSGMVQFNDIHKLQYNSLLGNKHGNLCPGRYMPMELENIQHHKTLPSNNHQPDRLSGGGAVSGCSISSFVDIKDSPLPSQPNQQHIQSGEQVDHDSLGSPSMSSDLFKRSTGGPSYSPDLGRYNGSWKIAVNLSGCAAKTLPLSAPLSRGDVSFSTLGAYSSPMTSNICSRGSLGTPQHDLSAGRNRQCQVRSGEKDMVFMPTSISEDSRFLNLRSTCNSRQKWEEPKRNHASEPRLLTSSSLNYPLSNHPLLDPLSERLDSDVYNTKPHMGQLANFSAPLLIQSFKADEPTFGHLN